ARTKVTRIFDLRITFIKFFFHILRITRRHTVNMKEGGRGGRGQIIAHHVKNVSFMAKNVNSACRANRSGKALRRAEIAFDPYGLGDRKSCLGDRKFSRPNSDRPNACPLTNRKGPFWGSEHHNFKRIN
ncbi:MAG: hypothetical protein SOW10_00590, partial [Alloprevotella sp.]|nr:hypothetical protein [Alloprevotella sp.]